MHRGVALSLGRLWLALLQAWFADRVVEVVVVVLLLLLHCSVLAKGEHRRHSDVAHS